MVISGMCVLGLMFGYVYLSYSKSSRSLPFISIQNEKPSHQDFTASMLKLRFSFPDTNYIVKDNLNILFIYRQGYEDHIAEIGISSSMSGTNDPQTLLQEVAYLSNSPTGIIRTSEAFGFTRFDLTPRGASAPIRYMKSVGNGEFIDVYYKNTGDDAMIESILTSIQLIPEAQ